MTGRAAGPAARQLGQAAGLLALSVLLDSAMEHYRGEFRNPAMYLPLAASGLALGASLHGAARRKDGHHPVRQGAFGLAAIVGLAGGGFHAFNVGKREGGFSWQNLFYGAPLGAPFALLLAGSLGAAGERLRNPARRRPGRRGRVRLFGLDAGRALAATASLGLLGTVAEVWLLHFRGAFHNPAMLLPVTVPPVGAGLLAAAAIGRRRDRRRARRWLRLTAWLGAAGVGFHVWGVQRNMGGWGNWRQNLLAGPPVPAPPGFTGLALAGLAALRLLEPDRTDPDTLRGWEARPCEAG